MPLVRRRSIVQFNDPMKSSSEKVCILSKERRKKQFERLVMILYARDSTGGGAIGDPPIVERQLKKLIQRLGADNSSVDVTVDDDPASLGGIGSLERSLGKYGVIVEEVAHATG